MGIDIYLKWPEMTEDDKKSQYTGMSTVHGNVGYLREAYHGGPYATKILCREAFEAENCEAEIPAAVMRERLTSITEPAYGCDGGHIAAAMLSALMQKTGGEVVGTRNADGRTTPMSVEDAVRTRYVNVYGEKKRLGTRARSYPVVSGLRRAGRAKGGRKWPTLHRLRLLLTTI